MEKFNAPVCEGMVHNYKTGLTRQGRWIMARDIPLQSFVASRGNHPHDVEGLAWDFDRSQWRNMKNARLHSTSLKQIQFTESDRQFTIV
jgi:hypothetical protein